VTKRVIKSSWVVSCIHPEQKLNVSLRQPLKVFCLGLTQPRWFYYSETETVHISKWDCKSPLLCRC